MWPQTSQKARTIGVTVLLAALSVGLWFSSRWRQERRTAEFHEAMLARDFARAERLWRRGVAVSSDDAFIEFMRFKDRLENVNGTQVVDWNLGPLQTINGTNRYFALVVVRDKAGRRFGLGLEWQGRKWVLKSDYPQVPNYVRDALTSNRQ